MNVAALEQRRGYRNHSKCRSSAWQWSPTCSRTLRGEHRGTTPDQTAPKRVSLQLLQFQQRSFFALSRPAPALKHSPEEAYFSAIRLRAASPAAAEFTVLAGRGQGGVPRASQNREGDKRPVTPLAWRCVRYGRKDVFDFVKRRDSLFPPHRGGALIRIRGRETIGVIGTERRAEAWLARKP